MTRSRGINAPKADWTEDRLESLRRLYADYKTEDLAFLLGLTLSQVYRKARELGLEKSEKFLTSAAGCAFVRDGAGGRVHRFSKGHTPWNKDRKGIQTGGVATRFKPGQHPPNTLPIGSTKLDKSQVLLQKVSNAPGNGSKRWRAVHELVWVAANGPVPAKHIVVFKPGTKTNVLEEITLDKVECISLAENMRRNTLHNLPPELKQVVQLRGVLTRAINKREKNEHQKH